MSRWRISRVVNTGRVVNIICTILLGVTAAAALFRASGLDSEDPYKCKALMREGRWLDIPNDRHSNTTFQNWQPPGCMLHHYNNKDISTCFQSRRIVLAGDSTIRQVFWAIAKKLDPDSVTQALTEGRQHADLSLNKNNVDLHFIWDPFLNTTRLHHELLLYQTRFTITEDNHDVEKQVASIILAGGGLWHARHFIDDPVSRYLDTIRNISSYSRPLYNPKTLNQRFVPPAAAASAEDLLLIAPVQVPLYEALSPDRGVTITPTRVDPMNGHLEKMAMSQSADVLFSFNSMSWHERLTYETNGLHVLESVASQKADIILNLRCNAMSTALGRYPFNRTCCSQYNRPNWLQKLLLLCGTIVFPLLGLVVGKGNKRLPLLPSSKVVAALLPIGLSLSYCFYTDRTLLFNKLHKQFSYVEFNALWWSTFGIGVLSIRRSESPRKPDKFVTSVESDQQFLSRDQTDEWKGWMQFVILIYHYTGASRVLWIYEIVRLLVASYLFMTGFGHTLYFYTKDNYSFHRFASVLIRLNFLSCLLPYMMKTDYLFYYFAPLVTFWFFVIYVTMRIGHSRNRSTSFLFLKIAISVIAVTALIRTPGILEQVSSVLKHVCKIDWNVIEWRFRVALDMYIVYVGMVAAVLYAKIDNRLCGRFDHGALLHDRLHFDNLRIITIAVSIMMLPGFFIFIRGFSDKYSYNSWHPYISPFIILAYVVLRNAGRRLRNYRSCFFAWLGRCSLETFTLQFHIWLAGDTKGLLSVGVFKTVLDVSRWLDFMVLTILFFWISWHVAAATGTLTSWIIDPKAGREVVEIEDGRGKATMGLPRTKSHEKFHDQHAGKISAARGITRRLWTLPLDLVKDDLRVRLGLLLGMMWLGNWTDQSLSATPENGLL
ncbi:hypothetical protein MMC26_005175 [Xylographa opegraphella]|nr:hypothetical protein [Xylographa opegraphella]